MEIWLDTIDVSTVQEASFLGLLEGVTTNPSILSRTDQVDEILPRLLDIQPGRLALQVTASHHAAMIEEGQRLFEFSDRVIIKIPVNREGLFAISQLSEQNIPVLGTAVFDVRQAFLAAKAGAVYVAPYVSHMQAAGIEAMQALRSMKALFQVHGLKTKIMAASVKQEDHILQCAQMGLEAITLNEDLFQHFLEDHPIAEAFTSKFNEQWKAAFADASIADFLI